MSTTYARVTPSLPCGNPNASQTDERPTQLTQTDRHVDNPVVNFVDAEELTYVGILNESKSRVRLRGSGTSVRCHNLFLVRHSRDIGLALRRSWRKCEGSKDGAVEGCCYYVSLKQRVESRDLKSGEQIKS